MSNQRHDQPAPAPAPQPGSSPWRAAHRWQCTDDAAMVNLITTVTVGVMLMVPALLLIERLTPTLGPTLTNAPGSLERISLD
jgi:hypothetical protein